MRSAIHSTERLVTTSDFASLLSLGGGAMPAELSDALDAIEVIGPQDVPDDLITMESHLVLTLGDAPQAQVVKLSWPNDAQPRDGRISILSPLGASLLGLRVGEVARWCGPNGKAHKARIDGVVPPPGAHGRAQARQP